MYNTDKNTWEKVRDGLKDIISRFEKYFGKLSPDSMLGKQGARLVKQNQEILDRFLAGVRAAADNAAYIENTTGEGGVKEMARTYGEGYNSIREKLAKKGLDQLSEALGERFPLSAEFLNYISSNNSLLNRTTVKANSVMPMKGESVYKAANRAFKSSYNGVITTVDLNDIGIKAVLPQRIVAESVTKVLNTSREQQTLDLIPFIKDILSNSILMNVERIEHVKNKNTVLYGYRLYNSYLYDTGNAVEERIVVSTVIQTTENAVGYIFDNIENVTKSQGSPKTKSGISQTTFSDISTVSKLYNAVKKIDRKIGGLKYNDDTRNKLFYYTETEKGVKYSSRDDDYLSAVNRGDMETAQRMVDEAAAVCRQPYYISFYFLLYFCTSLLYRRFWKIPAIGRERIPAAIPMIHA